MRALALICAFGFVGISAVMAASGAGAADRTPASDRIADPVIAQITHFRDVTWRWQRLMDVPVTRFDRSAWRSPDPAYRLWVRDLWQRRASRVQHVAARWLVARVRVYRETIEHWQRVMGAPAAPTRSVASASPPATASLAERRSMYLLWKKRAEAVLRQVQHPPYASAFACIHRLEGDWTDSGAPYYGGLQMDIGFQARYGGYLLRTKGTADHWTPLEQVWVAVKAARSGRGFYPWPNTARYCGLI